MKFYNDDNKEIIFEELQNENIDNKKVKQAKQKANFLGELANEFILLINILKDYWNGNFYISKKDLAIIIGAISYVALPLDAIPDFIPILGYSDDIGIVSMAIKKLADLIEQYKNK